MGIVLRWLAETASDVDPAAIFDVEQMAAELVPHVKQRICRRIIVGDSDQRGSPRKQARLMNADYELA